MRKAECRMQNAGKRLKDGFASKARVLAGRFIPFKDLLPWPKQQQAGFSLIEVLIALTVFSIGILAVASMQTTATGGNAKARYISEASGWAADRMELLMNLDYNDPLLADAGTNLGNAGLDDGLTSGTTADGSAASTNGAYTIFWNVVVDYPVTNVKMIRVIVTHNLLDNPVVFDFYKTAAI